MPPPLDLCLIRPLAGATETPVLGVALLDEYLRFVASRCRPNTVLAAAYDLKVFFTVVGKQPEAVRPADVLAFVTAQRSGRSSIDGPVGARRSSGVVELDFVGLSARDDQAGGDATGLSDVLAADAVDASDGSGVGGERRRTLGVAS